MLLAGIIPSLAALAVASVFVLILNYVDAKSKASFQIIAVVGTCAGCFAYLNAHSIFLSGLWASFDLLDPVLKFFLSLAIICVVFIGGGFYAIGPIGDEESASNQNETPATSDHEITFEVPSSLPSNDTEFFEAMFDRFTNEIINDLPTIYELPQEAVEWVKEMIPYTVAGGKMNRGLAVLAVQKSFAEHKGRTLSNKVSPTVKFVRYLI